MLDTIKFIYHASYGKIEYPSIKKSKFTKDFSWGFYCNTSKEESEKYADIFLNPHINVFKLNIMDTLNIKVFEEYNSDWLEFIIKCRSGEIHEYDIVIGPIADDSIYEYIDAYHDEQMNVQEFLNEMEKKYISKQVSFHTIRGLDSIEFTESYDLVK